MKRAALAALLALAMMAHGADAFADAPTPERLAAARKLFTEALRDEHEKRFDVALEKFRSVQQTKNTMAVRYRIASCEEELGRLRAALADFHALREETTTDPEEVGIVQSSKERETALDQRMPRLTLQLSARAPADAVVTLDDERLSAAALRGDILLDPGDHDVRATAAGAPPFASRVSVQEHARVALEIPLDPIERPRDKVPGTPPPTDTTRAGPPRRALGFALIGTGGAFALASAITLLLRRGEINTLTTACPGGACPADRQSELTAARSRALTEGPLAIVFAAVAAVTGGAGLYFVLAPTQPEKGAAGPSAAIGPCTVRGVF